MFEISMKEISRRRIMVMSSLNEISTDQLGNSREGDRHYSTRPHPFSTAVSDVLNKIVEGR